jgi:hypothetical protein
MFCCPCISIYLCNKNQLDALFILSLFLQSTSTCFGHNFSPSSGGILYIHNTYQLLYIYSIPPEDGLQICPKHIEVDWRNKLRLNSASSWFLLHSTYDVWSSINTFQRDQPISLVDCGWRVNHLKCLISLCLQKLCVSSDVKISVKTVVNTTNYLIRNSIGGMLLTTTGFGHQVAIVRLYTLK